MIYLPAIDGALIFFEEVGNLRVGGHLDRRASPLGLHTQGDNRTVFRASGQTLHPPVDYAHICIFATTEFEMRAIILAVCAMLFSTLANADGLNPANADVIMKCYSNDKPSNKCIVGCGTFQTAPGSPPLAAQYPVESVEIYTHGKATQGYDRQWIILNHGGEPRPNRTAIYLGANMSCAFNLQVWSGSPPYFTTVLRVEKFNQ